MNRLFIALITCLGLSGCATLSKSDCQARDWYGIGLQDGQNGQPLSRLSSHQEACSEHGIRLDGTTYRRGREEGLRTYCEPLHGAWLGRNGHTYYDVCHGPTAGEFRRNYRLGREYWEVEQEISRIEERVYDLRQRLESKDLAEHARDEIRDEIEDLRDNRRSLQRRLDLMDIVDLLKGVNY